MKLLLSVIRQTAKASSMNMWRKRGAIVLGLSLLMALSALAVEQPHRSESEIEYQIMVPNIDLSKGTPNQVLWKADHPRQLLYFAISRDFEAELWKLDARTLKAKRIAKDVPSKCLRPDGKAVAYVEDGRLRFWRVHSGAETSVKLPKELRGSPRVHPFQWSPDPKALTICRISRTKGALWIYDLTEERFTMVAHLGLIFPAYGQSTAWDPDSQRLLYPRYEKSGVRYFLFSRESDRRKTIQVPSGILFCEPSWTVENMIMVYGYDRARIESNRDDPHYRTGDFSQMYLIDLAKGKTKQLLSRRFRSVWYPVVSPSGQLVVFYARDEERRNKLMLTDRMGSFVTVLDEGITPGKRPMWSPDSKMIVYDKIHPVQSRITLGLVTLDQLGIGVGR